MSILVDSLIEQVRSQTDEANTDDITDTEILASLNRAQRHTANIISRRFPEMLWESTTFTTVGGQRNYPIPTEVYASRVLMLEVASSQDVRFQIQKISNFKSTNFITSSQTDLPTHWTQKRNELELYPTPRSGKTIHVYYFKRPEDLVVQQGRITSIDTDNNYILVDDIGSSLSTITTGFGAYVNLCDYHTGEVHRSLQISALDTTSEKITFKGSGLTRSTVLDKTISTTISTDAAVDDYVSLVTGTCIPEIDGAYTDYIIQHAVVATKRRLGEPVAEDEADLKEMKAELMKAWESRPQSHRVRKASKAWVDSTGLFTRRLLF